MKTRSTYLTFFLLLTIVGVGFAQNKSDMGEAQRLISKLCDEDDAERYTAMQALSNFGQGVVPALSEIIKNDRGYKQVYAARTLQAIDPNSQIPMKALADIAKNKQEKKDVRRYAVYVMALSIPGIKTVAGMLKDEDVFIRRSAVFAIDEIIENGEYVPAALTRTLYDYLPALASSLADDDKIVAGVAGQAFMDIHNEDLPALNDAAKSSDVKLRKAAIEAIKKRKSEPRSEGDTADAKPGFEEVADKSPKMQHGNLGLIRALRLGGEPVRDYREIPDSNNSPALHITFKPATGKMSIRLNRFSPYQDM
jgi:HEAT repeat protein